MSDVRHIASTVVGTTTTAIGGLSLADVQTALGIIATVAGLTLTIATFVWRRREHGERMRTKKRKNDIDKDDPTDKCN